MKGCKISKFKTTPVCYEKTIISDLQGLLTTTNIEPVITTQSIQS